MGCNKCKKDKCIGQDFCNYKLSTSADYVVMEKDLDCIGLKRGKKVEDALIKIDEYLCMIDPPSYNPTSIENIGDGVEVYKGKRGDGVQEFRTLVSENNNLEITQDENEVLFKLNVDKFEIDTACDEGISLIEENLDNKTTLKALKSSSLNIEDNDGCISIEIEEQIGIPRYIVNNLYTGDEEKGTTTKPFKTIRAAFDEFIGNGTIDQPENQGAYIIIQKGNVYDFKDNLTARNLNVIVEEGAEIDHNPLSNDWFINYDLMNDNKSVTNLELKRNSRLILRSLGFKNRGSLGGEPQYKTINISGEGKIEFLGSINTGHELFISNSENIGGYAMPNRQTFNIEGIFIESDKKAIWDVGGDSTLRFKNCSILHGYKNTIIPTTIKSFRQVGGEVVLDNCEFLIGGTKRDDLFYIKNEYATKCTLKLYRCKFTHPQSITNLFHNADSLRNAYLECNENISEPATSGAIANIFKTSIKWDNLFVNNNHFPSGIIDSNVDLTQGNSIGVTNWIGGQTIGFYQRYDTRQDAINAGLKDGTVFLKKITIDQDDDEWLLTTL